MDDLRTGSDLLDSEDLVSRLGSISERPSGSLEFLKLEVLILAVAEGRAVLPSFQRRFQWDREDVRALLATVMVGWPAGTLMLLDRYPDFLGPPRSFSQVPEVVPAPSLTVLDGQQRLTALFFALFDQGPAVYALNLETVARLVDQDVELDADVLEDAVESFSRRDWDRRYRSIHSQWVNRLLPAYVLRSPALLFEWLSKVESLGGSEDQLGIPNLASRILSGLFSYSFPALILDATLDAGAIARVFERVNKSGLQLDTFDLVVARTFLADWNLRTVVDQEAREDPVLGHFLNGTGLLPLQVIALRHVGNVRRRTLIRLERDLVRSEWSEAVACLRRVIDILARRCGLLDRSFLPSNPCLSCLRPP